MSSFDMVVSGPPDQVLELLRTALATREDDRFVLVVEGVVRGRHRADGQAAGQLVPTSEGVRLVGTCGVDPQNTRAIQLAGAAIAVLIPFSVIGDGDFGSFTSVLSRGFALLSTVGFGLGFLYLYHSHIDGKCATASHARLRETVRDVETLLAMHDG